MILERAEQLSRLGTALIVAGGLAIALAGCEKPAERTATPAAAEHEQTAKPTELPLPDVSWIGSAKNTEATGTFLDRAEGTDIRFVSYNVLWNNIFREVSPENAEKFARVMQTLRPDIVALQEIGVTHWMLEENPDARDWRPKDVEHLFAALLPEKGTWHAYRGKDNVIVARYPLSMTADHTKPRGDRDQAMALVDLPDGEFSVDLYIMNNHYKCCDAEENDPRRQKQSDSIVAWIRDARTAGGEIDLPANTPIIVAGDLNIVGSFQPVDTLLEGDILDEGTYGEDFAPDWDNTGMIDLHPMHNIEGPDDYTWRDDNSRYDPSRLDFVVFTDSVLVPLKSFVLNTTSMSAEDLAATGLEKLDITVDQDGRKYDHLPLVVDFDVAAEAPAGGE